jgi:hypothetical protein
MYKSWELDVRQCLMMFNFKVSDYSNRDVRDIISKGNGENMKSKAIPVTVRGACSVVRC